MKKKRNIYCINRYYYREIEQRKTINCICTPLYKIEKYEL